MTAALQLVGLTNVSGVEHQRSGAPVAAQDGHTTLTAEPPMVDLYLDQQQLDTTTPTGKLLFHVTGTFSEFERSMIRQRVNAGLNAIKAKISLSTSCC